MANEKIRSRARENKVPYWRIAQALGVCENTVYRMMRTKLSGEQEEAINTAIDSIIDRKEEGCKD